MNGMTTVEFPGLLGLKLNISNVAFSIFGFKVFWYGIIIASALLLSLFLALRCCESFGIKKDDFVDFMIVAVPSAVVMARLYYVIFKWEDFAGDLGKILNIRTGGLAIYGAVIGSIVSAYIFTKVKKYNTFKFFDFAVVYLPLGQAIGRWGNFFNQEAFGTNTSLPWGMKSQIISEELSVIRKAAESARDSGFSFPNMDFNLKLDPLGAVHPTFLYESLLNLLLFFFLLHMRKNKKFDGEVFALYMLGYGFIRFFIEGLRTDSLMYGSFRASQILAMIFCVIFSGFILFKRRKMKLSCR